jgi:5-carboxymethyl-2-hydroxymuconate isomerase
MPHLTLEYSSNITQEIDFQALFLELHQMVAEQGNTLVANCKSRAYRLDDYLVAGGEAGAAFVHLTIRLFAGKPLEARQRLGRESLRLLEAYYAPSLAELALQITVEIGDIEQATYFKR